MRGTPLVCGFYAAAVLIFSWVLPRLDFGSACSKSSRSRRVLCGFAIVVRRWGVELWRRFIKQT